MYVRTPKRYRGPMRRSIIPFRRILFWLVMTLLIVVGIGIYENRAMIQPVVNRVVVESVRNVEGAMATMSAPTPTPTQDPTNNLIRAENFWRQGSISEAVDLYLSALDSVPNNVDIHYRVTLGLIMEGQIERALEYAERTVTANPFAPDAWAMRAWALDWNARYGESIASALHAIELIPQDAPNAAEMRARALAYLAEAYLGAGQAERAFNTAEDAIEVNPDGFEGYRARGLIYWQSRFDLDSALADFQTAFSLARNMTYIAIDIAIVEQARGNPQGAIDVLEDIIEVNPENTLALFWLGSFYFRDIGDPSQAAAYLTRCIDYNPNSINCHYMLGRSQARLEQYQAAAESFKQAVELGSTNPYHWWWAGRSQIDIGNCAQAMAYLEPGYDLALQGTDADIIRFYEEIMPECRGFGFGIATPTPPPINEEGVGDL